MSAAAGVFTITHAQLRAHRKAFTTHGILAIRFGQAQFG
jgi:hypothetical protein